MSIHGMVVPPPNSPITSESPSSPDRNHAFLDMYIYIHI